MKAAIKKKWVKALRSGEFEQGRHALCLKKTKEHEAKYCCLGVLAEINGNLSRSPGKLTKYIKNNPGKNGALTEGLRDHFGLTSDQENKLISMNDDKDWSFKKIASWIERYL